MTSVWFIRGPILFTVGVLTLLTAALTITTPLVAGSLLVVGTVCLSVGGVKLWRFGWQMLDLAVGAYSTALEE